MTVVQFNVLLADDDEDDRLFFRDALSEIALKTAVEMVNDGAALIEYLIHHIESLPDIIFLDLNMPKKDGIQCLKEIRRSPELSHLCVAVYSTSASEKDIEDTLALGANIYIRKPNDYSKLKKVLSRVLTMNWQYHNSSLNRTNFLLSI